MAHELDIDTLMQRAQESRALAAYSNDPRVASVYQTIANTYTMLVASRINDRAVFLPRVSALITPE